LTGHYPAPFASPENEFLVPVYLHDGDPDPAEAAMSRAAGLAMVAYDTNALDSQLWQGWLMRDRFLMRGSLGAVYEFLWANPYQPGLSYYHVPLLFHDDLFGRLFVRSSWEENAKWTGYYGHELQVFEEGKPGVVNPQLAPAPIHMAEAIVL